MPITISAAATGSSCPAGTCPRKQKRPRPTPRKVFNWFKAMLAAGTVSAEVQAEREAICATCDLARRDDKGLWCSACGCGVDADAKRILNLTRYNEGPIDPKTNKPQWGCKHPKRGKGGGAKGWRR